MGLLAVVLASLVAAPLATAAPVPPSPTPQRVSQRIWLIPGGILPNRQPDGNTVVFDDSQGGLVVMDTGRHKWHRDAILEFALIRHMPIVAIINSHWHLDHVSGNPDLKRAYPNAKVYASRAINDALKGFLAKSAAASRKYLETGKLPPETQEDIRNDIATVEKGAALVPDVPIDASRVVAFGNLKLHLNLAPNAATAGDVWVYDPASRVAAVGDLVTLPAPFLDTACPEGWRLALTRIWATPFQIAIPGHGAPMNRAAFARYRRAFEAVIDCSRTARTKADCAAEWVNNVRPMLGPDPTGAQSMTEYYVQDVLRANGGKSPSCKTA
jgi:glyoxylase-like metal-dependent hydrolase (beta-lactamase superfamily II)